MFLSFVRTYKTMGILTNKQMYTRSYIEKGRRTDEHTHSLTDAPIERRPDKQNS